MGRFEFASGTVESFHWHDSQDELAAIVEDIEQGAFDPMKILNVRYAIVEIEDNTGYHSTVFEQSDKRLKCQSSRCKSRNHYRCEHMQFVESQHVVFPESSLTPEDYECLIDD